MLVNITQGNIDEYMNGSLPLVLDFWAPWCGQCKMLAPRVTELAEQYDDQIVIGKCDAENEEELAKEFGIRNIPALLFIKNNVVESRLSGACAKNVIEDNIKKLLGC